MKSSPVSRAPGAEIPQPGCYANFSVMLANPAGGGVVLMHNPKNELEFVEVEKTPQAFSAGYVPVRAVELDKVVAALRVVTSAGGGACQA